MKFIESEQQQMLIKWANLHYSKELDLKIGPYLIAIPNGGKRNVREAARLKAEGVKAGVPDLLLALPNKQHHGLFIEMKSQTGRLTDNQKQYFELLSAQKYKCVVCRSWIEAKDQILWYLKSASS
ncbi:MAG: VRR-NUC domain-containing protein [Chitinophagia bacterium]|nr:VRR-NUC domain-containing protein [Chitinophagia bacterium]